MTRPSTAKEIHAASADAKTYSESLKAIFRIGSSPASSISPPGFFIRAPLNGASQRSLGSLGQDFRS